MQSPLLPPPTLCPTILSLSLSHRGPVCVRFERTCGVCVWGNLLPSVSRCHTFKPSAGPGNHLLRSTYIANIYTIVNIYGIKNCVLRIILPCECVIIVKGCLVERENLQVIIGGNRGKDVGWGQICQNLESFGSVCVICARRRGGRCDVSYGR